jgi:hypothetical protein
VSVENTAWVESHDFGRMALPNGFEAYKHGFGCSVDGPDWGVELEFSGYILYYVTDAGRNAVDAG